MADGYWNRQQPTSPMLSSGGMLKRPRTDYDAPPSGMHSALEMHNYLQERMIKLDIYLGVGGAMPSHPIADPPVMGRLGSAAPDLSPNGQNVGFSGQVPVDAMTRPGRDTIPLPPDASNTIR
ncbi:Detected protein of unknown function [Hibiscus syriacus]|uniref:Uncharacterized protein n=1 Tax=Hibiscus syriacus TaxID=106335 RepID=A0A6A2YS45_HIBSY|nr:Detected protein of unknown function [Hibiscus syriacus]